MTRIKLNLNARSDAYKNAYPRLRLGINSIMNQHSASGLATIVAGDTGVHVVVRYMSGAALRDIVAYLNEMQLLD